MALKAYRLPKDILPRQYDVHLDARLGRDDVIGKATIQLEVVKPRPTIEVHVRNIVFLDVRFKAGERTLSGVAHQDAEREMVTLQFSEQLPAGRGQLTIDFRGQIGKDLRGLYLAQDGPEQVLCTQCEPTDARAIFPCFDEPEFKARFAFQITTTPEVIVLANGSLVSVSEVEGSKTWKFAPTKPMSSYLVALTIGDIASTTEQQVAGVPLRVWSMSGKERMGKFAQGYTARLLPWFEDYFGVPYHFEKYDQVAVPGFAAGAMENVGLVLFRQPLLLTDSQTTSWRQEKNIAHVVAHEFAHMWFGDLVTMRWWDDIWLNESFAEWISYKALDELSPDYTIWDDFQTGKSYALGQDALESTHSIYAPVATPEEAMEMFDTITYVKGCAVLRMLENYLGSKKFRAGIRTYMQEFAESNAVGADLWRHLQAASQEPVTQIMESWIMQAGYPRISLALQEIDSSYRLELRQQRFYSSPFAAANTQQLWQVPIVIRYEDDAGVHETRYLMSERQANMDLEVTGKLHWCYANAGEIGFYRQDQGAQIMGSLLENIQKLTPSEQIGLLSDQWALTRSGDQNITRFLDVLGPMSASEDHHVLAEVVARLHSVEDLLEDAGDEDALQHFRAWAGGLFVERLEVLGHEPQEGESQNTAQMRVSLVDAVARLAHNSQEVERARQLAGREAEDPAGVDPNLAPLYITITAQFGDAPTFDQFVEIYRQRKASGASPQETDRYLNSFVHFRVPELVERTLRLLEERVLPQESVGPVLRAMLSQRHAQLAAWDFIKTRWDLMPELGMTWIESLVAASGYLPHRLRDDLVAFYDSHLEGRAQMSYARALETMDQLAEFKDRTRDDLVAWFNKA